MWCGMSGNQILLEALMISQNYDLKILLIVLSFSKKHHDLQWKPTWLYLSHMNATSLFQEPVIHCIVIKINVNCLVVIHLCSCLINIIKYFLKAVLLLLEEGLIFYTVLLDCNYCIYRSVFPSSLQLLLNYCF